MSDLETLLRELRPEPDPAWTARLDSRVANRFPAPPPKWRLPFMFLRRNVLAVGSLAALALVIVFVATQVNHSGSDGFSSDSAKSGSSASRPAGKTASGGLAGSSASPDAAVPQARAQLRSAELTISVPNADVDTLSDRAIRVVDGLGGYVSDSSVSTTASRASASLTLAIPSDKLQQGLAQLSKLGHVTRRTQEATDVTDQKAQLEAAVRDARADQAGLRRRLAKAATDKERSHLRALLETAARRITARERAVAKLGREVAYANVELTIRGARKHAAAAPPPGRWTPGDALHDAGRVLEVAAGVLVIALALGLPIALVVALIAVAGRITARRRRERALEMA